MAVNDLAGSDLASVGAPLQLWAGEAQIVTDSALALAAITKFQLCALTAAGVTPFVVGTHVADQAVVSAQPAASGAQCPYYDAGKFNHEAITWPVTLDTLAKRKFAMAGTDIRVGHLVG
jgi:hypothetical protein